MPAVHNFSALIYIFNSVTQNMFSFLIELTELMKAFFMPK